MDDNSCKKIEIRGFLHLDSFLRNHYGSLPLSLDLETPTTARELAVKLKIPLDEIEVVFVNGTVQPLNFTIKPGDRVAFLPPGCPGPYRIALGFYGKNQNNEANFRIRKKVTEEGDGANENNC